MQCATMSAVAAVHFWHHCSRGAQTAPRGRHCRLRTGEVLSEDKLSHFLNSSAKPFNFLLPAAIIVKLHSISKVSHSYGYGFCDQKSQDLMREGFLLSSNC